MDALHHVIGSDVGHFAECDALGTLGRGIERSQRFQLYRHSLADQFGQTLGDLLQHALDDVLLVGGAVVNEVLGEAFQRECRLDVHLGIILAETGILGVLVLAEINPHCNTVFCHC